MEDLNTSYFLPHRYKRVGWAIIGIHVLLIALTYILDQAGVRTGLEHLLLPLLNYTVMIGLTIVISSREEKEDEMIRLVRLKSFQYGLYLTVFVAVVMIILRIIGPYNFEMPRVRRMGGINAMLIFIIAIYQFNLFKLRSDEE